MRTFNKACSILMVILLSACEFAAADKGAVARSDLPRDPVPAVSAADAQSLLEGNSAFAFDLYNLIPHYGNALFVTGIVAAVGIFGFQFITILVIPVETPKLNG